MQTLLPFVLILALTAFGCESDSGDPLNNTSGGPAPGSTLDTTGSGGGGGSQTDPDSGTTGPAAPTGTIKALQQAAEEAGCTEDGGFPATVLEATSIASAVVTSPRFVADEDEAGTATLDGYYIADGDQAPWSGIMLTVPSSENTDFKPGDVLTLVGDLEEAWCNTQLSVEANGYEVVETTDLLEPLAIDGDAADFEPYEGMLVSVSDIAVESETDWGGYVLEGGLEVSWGFGFFLSMEVGERYDIVGQIKYAYSAYKIFPRTEDDYSVVGGGSGGADGGGTTTGDGGGTVDPGPSEATTISDLQQTDASLVCPDVSIVNITENLVLEGYVTVPSFDIHETLNAYGLWSGDDATYSGVVLVVDKTMDEAWQVGQHLRVTGEHLEFYCLTEFKASAVEVIDSTDPSFAPMVVADFADNAEAYEGMVITVENATVTNVDNFGNYGEVETDGGFLIDDWVLGSDVLETPTVGEVYCSVTGLVAYSFGSYRINPRSADDLVACTE